MTTIPPVPSQFDITAALNRALFLNAAVKTIAANLAVEEDKLKAAMAELEVLMQTQKLAGIASTLGRADFVPKIVYNATDWNAVNAHVQKTGEFDLYQRRLLQTACRDRDTNNELPPGIRRVQLLTLKLEAI